MGEIADWERAGIEDFFNAQSTPDLVTALAKTVSKNILAPKDVADATDVVILHSTGIHSILNRRGITKEILFKYLHDKKVPVPNNFNKQLLIDRILQHWKQTYGTSIQSVCIVEECDLEEYVDEDDCPEVDMIERETIPQPISTTDDDEQFPINRMAREFAHWFYTKLNVNALETIDFWRDVQCSAQFLERGVVMVSEEHSSNENVLRFCQNLRSQYELYFNLNETHSGTQGRIESHGLVLVLSCGTLHKVERMVGTFESVFGLARDPFSDNNWKVNRVKMRLHNNPGQQQQQAITLTECETLAPLLSLSVVSTSEGIG